MSSQGREIQVITRGIALENEDALYPQHLLLGRNNQRHPEALDARRFERFIPDQLPHARLDTVELSQDLHRALHSGGFPPGYALQIS